MRQPEMKGQSDESGILLKTAPIRNFKLQTVSYLHQPNFKFTHEVVSLQLNPLNTADMFDMMKMMGKMKEVQARMKEAQDNVVKLRAHGESGGGMVKVVVNGKKNLIALDIDSSLLKVEDKIILQDLVVAAVNKAVEEAEALAKDEMKKSTEGLLPNIPGLDLGSMLG